MDTIRRYASSLGFGSVVAAFNDRDVIATIRQVLEWHVRMSDADLLAIAGLSLSALRIRDAFRESHLQYRAGFISRFKSKLILKRTSFTSS